MQKKIFKDCSNESYKEFCEQLQKNNIEKAILNLNNFEEEETITKAIEVLFGELNKKPLQFGQLIELLNSALKINRQKACIVSNFNRHFSMRCFLIKNFIELYTANRKKKKIPFNHIQNLISSIINDHQNREIRNLYAIRNAFDRIFL